MSHPEQANEPTMEEILASIRRIISDDDRPESGQEAQPAEEPAAPEPEPLAPSGDMNMMGETALPGEDESDAALGGDSGEGQAMAEQAKDQEDATAEDTFAEDTFAEDKMAEDDAAVFQLTDDLETAEQPAPADDKAGDKSDEIVFAADEDEMDKSFAAGNAAGADAPAEASSGADEPARDLLSSQSHQSVQQAFASLENFVMSTHARTLEDLVSEMMRPMLREWLDANLPPLTERLVREEIERVSRGRR